MNGVKVPEDIRDIFRDLQPPAKKAFAWADVSGTDVDFSWHADFEGSVLSNDNALQQEFEKLKTENFFLKEALNVLTTKIQQRIERLEQEGLGNVIVLREISRDQAKQEIKSLFQAESESLYYSDIAERLQIDLKTVVEICHELRSEGLIAPTDAAQ